MVFSSGLTFFESINGQTQNTQITCNKIFLYRLILTWKDRVAWASCVKPAPLVWTYLKFIRRVKNSLSKHLIPVLFTCTLQMIVLDRGTQGNQDDQFKAKLSSFLSLGRRKDLGCAFIILHEIQHKNL